MGGNVGIGTTSPDARLHVYTTGYPSGKFERYGTSTATRGWTQIGHSALGYSGGTGADSYIISQNGFGFAVNEGTNALTITDGAKVGIGTNNPGAKLHVTTATAGFAAKFINTNTATDSNGVLIQSGTALSEYSLKVASTDGNTTFMTVKGTGNVGIGTSAPGHLLDILKSGSGDATVNINSTTGGDPTLIFNSAAANRQGIIKFQDNGTNVGRIDYVHNGDRIDIQAGSASGATMSIKNGAVGIGTTTPEASLDITPDSSKKTIRVDNISQRGYQEYVISGTIGANAVTITMQCPSYFQAEVVATFQQSNGGTDMNVYYNGIWSNNHTTHLFKNKTDGGTVPRIGGPLSQNPTYSVGVGDAESNSGKLIFTKAAQSGTSGTYCVRVIAYGYSSKYMTYVVS
jgi:hypothetical protein